MNAEYYGWLGAKGYDTVIKIEDYDAYVYRTCLLYTSPSPRD